MHHEPVCEPEPFDSLVKVRLTSTQLDALNCAAGEQGVTRSWLIREALHRGLPLLLTCLKEARAAGFSVGGARRASRASKVFRGPRAVRAGDAAFAPTSGAVAVDRRTLQDPE